MSRLGRAQIEYEETDFYKLSNAVLGMIQNKFEEYGFVKNYIKYENEEGKFYEYVMSVLRKVPDVELFMLNEMHKMLSESNCWCVHYHIGEVVHNVCVELFGIIRR